MNEWVNIYNWPELNIRELVGLTLEKIESTHDEINFHTTEGRHFKMFHLQDCCESVTVEDINGDLESLVGSPITMAEESSNSGAQSKYGDTQTWTFYRISNGRGFVTIRWHGTSNGYYSESVDFREVILDEKE